MKYNPFFTLISRISLIGAHPGDPDEIRLQKSLLTISAFPFMLTGAAWGIVYILSGEQFAGLIPLSYTVFSLISVVYFGVTRRFAFFRFTQLLLILLLPFALMIALGGYINSGAVILWGLICPLGAMLVDKQSNALVWLAAYILLLVVGGILQPLLSAHNNLTKELINLFFVFNLIGVGALVFMMVYYFVGKKNFFQARSESLLLNILPGEIAEELKTTGRAEAKQFDVVTVMFTDFKNFTRLSEKLSPAELVTEIDTCFKAFDNIASRHNLEKIKTIGDSYMCAGGLPVANTTSAFDTISAALEILQYIRDYSDQLVNNGKDPLEIRIGIHSGPVVAGIVGLKKFAYDIWGDTVNIASRIESSGEAGKINISGRTHDLVKDQFSFTYREKIHAKNKGEIEMYFVEGPIGV
jgi:adenylate cyclase